MSARESVHNSLLFKSETNRKSFHSENISILYYSSKNTNMKSLLKFVLSFVICLLATAQPKAEIGRPRLHERAAPTTTPKPYSYEEWCNATQYNARYKHKFKVEVAFQAIPDYFGLIGRWTRDSGRDFVTRAVRVRYWSDMDATRSNNEKDKFFEAMFWDEIFSDINNAEDIKFAFSTSNVEVIKGRTDQTVLFVRVWPRFEYTII